MKTLNVGCGKDKWGDVRLDIKRQFSPTIIADAQNLPFRKNSFKIAKASHILEHLSKPNEAMNELLNVTTEKLIIAFPTEKDVMPCIISSFISLNWRMVSFYFKYWKLRWHKWIIKHEALTKFLERHGWRCTTKKGRKHVFNILRSKRLPHRIRSLIKLSPQITHEYIIEAEKKRRWALDQATRLEKLKKMKLHSKRGYGYVLMFLLSLAVVHLLSHLSVGSVPHLIRHIINPTIQSYILVVHPSN